jgi:hypothetical protein
VPGLQEPILEPPSSKANVAQLRVSMPITENTVNDLVADLLRSRGIDITTQTSARTVEGNRQPDFELHREGRVFFGEGEWMSTYADGVAQAVDYGDLPGASGYFLIAYPDEFRERITKRRATLSDPAALLEGLTLRNCLFKSEGHRADVRKVEIASLHSWISSVVAKGPSLPEREEFVSVMHSVVNRLTDYLPSADDYPRLFEHVVATIPQDETEKETARRAAAYLLMNQLMFYRMLSEHRELGYSPLEPKSVRGAPDVRVLFEEVMRRDYHAIFKTNVIDLFPGRAFPFIRSLLRLISDVRPEEFTHDLMGSIFHSLIPLSVRKPVAAYYTNPGAARLLVKLVGVSGNDSVGDLSCGSGTLLVAAYEAKAASDKRPDDQSRHATYLEHELTGVDIMPFAAHMAVVQLALLNPVQWTNRVQIAVDDSTEHKPGDLIRSIERSIRSPQTRLGEFDGSHPPRVDSRKGAVSADGIGTEFILTSQDVVLMNPPFTRKQFIKKGYREELRKLFGEYSRFVRNDMGYFGYFVLLADRFLVEQGGRLGLVLPAGFLRQESLAGLRKLLREKYRVRYLVMSKWKSAFSEDASFRDILLVATKTSDRSGPCIAAMVKRRLDGGNIEWVFDHLNQGAESEDVAIRKLDQNDLLSEDWLSLIPEAAPDLSTAKIPPDAPVCPLRKIPGATLIQGIRMESSSDYANTADTLLSTARDARTRADWLIVKQNRTSVEATDKDGVRRITVPKSVLEPATRSISGMNRLSVLRPPDFVVVGRFSGDRQFWVTKNPNVMLSQRRKHVASRMGRVVLAGYGNVNLIRPGTHHLAVLSNPRIAPTWTCWSLDMSNLDDAKIVTLWWNSVFNLLHLLGKKIDVGGGVVKWRYETLLDTPVLDSRKLSPRAKEKLIREFDRLSRSDFPSLVDQYSKRDVLRSDLDRAVGVALGYKVKELDAILNDAYVTVTDELSQVASMDRQDAEAKHRKTGRKRPSATIVG